MVSKIVELFFRKSFQIKEVDYKTALQSVSFSDLFSRRLDVLIVKNFLNEIEVESTKQNLKNLDNNLFTWHDNRYKSIPPVFEALWSFQNLNDYFNYCHNRQLLVEEKFKISLEKKILEWYCLNFGYDGYKISSIKLKPDLSHPFPTGSYRIIPSSYGEIKIHADNNFYPSNSELFSSFADEVDLSNHVSCILTIQKANSGGNLVLHDIDYLEYDRLSANGLAVISKSTGKEREIKDFKSYEINVSEGDLVLFSGGQIWHSVNKMSGENDRITYGGFSALSRDGKKIYLWT